MLDGGGEQAACRISRDDGWSAIATFEQRIAGVDAEARSTDIGVAGVAACRKKWPDAGFEEVGTRVR